VDTTIFYTLIGDPEQYIPATLSAGEYLKITALSADEYLKITEISADKYLKIPELGADKYLKADIAVAEEE
jgi:hypothetical protein